MHFYRISGLSVAIEIALPGLIEGHSSAAAEVTIRQGPVPDRLFEVQATGPTWQAGPRQFLLDIPGIARFLLSDGRDITCAPASLMRAFDFAKLPEVMASLESHWRELGLREKAA